MAIAVCASTAWWVFSAGPKTVLRIVVHNFSSTEDYRIFPQRKLAASARPFRFREHPPEDQARWAASQENPLKIPFADFLHATGTTSFLIVKDGTVLFEHYGDGHGRSSPSMTFSMTKSIFSILVGCAVEDGYFKSLDQPVTDFVPELRGRGFDAVTIRHLLQMTSGINYAESDWPFGIHARFYYTNQLVREILNLRLAEKPGTRFSYKSGDAFLLALALERALGGKSITDYMQARLWTPMGMESDGYWSIDHEPDGLEKVGCCLTATARDLAKFGQLFINKGVWNGHRIVSTGWIERASRSDATAGASWEYQYLWWRVAPNSPAVVAKGHLGQFLYVDPATKLVIVRLGNSLGHLSVEEWDKLFASISGGRL